MAVLRDGIAVVVVGAWLAMASAAIAAATTWTPTSVRGVVVYLLDGKWEEVTRGQALTEATLRTLRSGRLSLTGPNVTLDVGPNSALQLAMKADGTAGTIEQYLGSISVAAQQSNAGLTVRAGKVTLSSITGELSVLVADTGTSIIVESGTAAVTSAGGKKLVLDTGRYSADAAGLVVEASSGAASTTEQTAAAAATEAAGSSTGNNGNANGAGNGNGAGGNGNGNNGNGNGNGGGNGNGNNGNGNGNGGGNGNGNGKDK